MQRLPVLALLTLPLPSQDVEPRRGPDALDVVSTREVRAHTTDPSFLTAWVDHVPEHPTVPSPRDFLGYSVGTPGKLTPPERIHAYMRELERTSDRVMVLPIGESHGGREMVLVAVADAGVLARMDEIVLGNHFLAEPREIGEEEAREIAKSIPPTYCITAGLHSPETGPPEMVMELVYRLAVSDQDHVREIRENVLTLVIPVLEVDGRARQVDWYYRHLTGVTDLEDAPPRSAPYWGDYTYHDNNRDGLQVSQPLTRNYVEVFHRFLPTVSLDLHESVPLLYVSTGTGPYNETIDPITVTEWQWMASWDVSRATELGLRGVWSWGFYTGWYPGYLLWVTNTHNAVGRFYETFGNSLAGTFERDLSRSSYADERVDSRQWYRAWPPEKELVWSLRNNTNYMQTGVLASLQLAGRNGDTLLFNFWRKGANALKRGRAEAPHAFVIPGEQRDPGSLRYLHWLLGQHRIEVHRATAAWESSDGVSIREGDLVVRLDQPYRDFAVTLLSRQRFPEDADHTPYDDVSWSLPLMLGLEVTAIDDPAVLDAPVEEVYGPIERTGTAEAGARWIVDHAGQLALAGFAWSLPDARVSALAAEWEGHPAGSLLVSGIDPQALADGCERFLLDALAVPAEAAPEVLMVNLPRVALFHTWTYTQDSGWVRYTLEQLGVPFELIDKDDLRAGDLGARFDVILVPSQGRGDLVTLVHGVDERWGPLAYTHTDEYPSHGTPDASTNITGGMGFEGLANLHAFVRAGGLLITLGSAGALAVDSGLAREVWSEGRAGTPGSHVTAKVLRPEHPVTFGYEPLTHVFRGDLPRWSVPERLRGRVLVQYGTRTTDEAEAAADRRAGVPVDEDPAPQDEAAERPPVCLSGVVKDADALERYPALLDVPVGAGRVLLFSWNPMHRFQNHHDVSFLINALLFFDDFPDAPTEEEMRARE